MQLPILHTMNDILDLRLPRISALTTPMYRLITPNETGKETVTAGCGGDGG